MAASMSLASDALGGGASGAASRGAGLGAAATAIGIACVVAALGRGGPPSRVPVDCCRSRRVSMLSLVGSLLRPDDAVTAMRMQATARPHTTRTRVDRPILGGPSASRFSALRMALVIPLDAFAGTFLSAVGDRVEADPSPASMSIADDSMASGSASRAADVAVAGPRLFSPPISAAIQLGR